MCFCCTFDIYLHLPLAKWKYNEHHKIHSYENQSKVARMGQNFDDYSVSTPKQQLCKHMPYSICRLLDLSTSTIAEVYPRELWCLRNLPHHDGVKMNCSFIFIHDSLLVSQKSWRWMLLLFSFWKGFIFTVLTLPVKMFGPFWSVWCKTALAEVGMSLPWWCPALVLQAPGYWSLFLNLIIFS